MLFYVSRPEKIFVLPETMKTYSIFQKISWILIFWRTCH